jgi:hypothetical protein
LAAVTIGAGSGAGGEIGPRMRVSGRLPDLPISAHQPRGPAVCRMVPTRGAQRTEEWKLASAKTGAHHIGSVPWFCAKQTCPVVIRDVIVYRDSNASTPDTM